MATSIPIRYINSTSETDFQVIVFTKNFSVNTPETFYVAWQVLSTQTEADFVYPVDTSVGATYMQGGTTIHSGPLPANLGSTWSIVQEAPTGAAILSESESALNNIEYHWGVCMYSRSY